MNVHTPPRPAGNANRLARRAFVWLSLIGSLATAHSAEAAESVELTGHVEIRAVNCFNPEPHEHEEDYLLVESKSQRRLKLVADRELLRSLKPDQQIRVTGQSEAQRDARIGSKSVSGDPEEAEVFRQPIFQVESIEFEPQRAGGGAEAMPPAAGANSLEMLSCLLIFASTNTHSSMTNVSNATGLLFDNPTNANEGMQAVTKGRFGLQLGNGTGVPEDHIIEVRLDIDSADVVGTSAMETLIRDAVFGTGAGQLGINRYAYNRILIFPPGGYQDPGGSSLEGPDLTAYAYYGGPVGSAGNGRISLYGGNYGNSRMNGYIHELGHNFGFRHSTKPNTSNEYRDRTCVMGLSNDATKTETYGSVKLMSTDWLDVFPGAGQTLTTDATLNLYPLSSDPDEVPGTIAVSIQGTDYYVAYHRNEQPYGYLSQSGDRDKVFVYTNTSSSALSYQVANLSVGGRYEGLVDISFDAYGMSDGYATVSIDIDDGNSKPELANTVFGTGQNAAVILDLTATDPDGDAPLSYATISDPANGALSGTLPNLTYTPDNNFTGSDSFRISVNDGLISNFIDVTVLVYIDTDSDGLEDAWELQYFGDLSQGPTDNPDEDPDNNLAEFQNGTDPSRASTVFSQLTGTVIGTTGSYLSDPAWDRDEAHDGDLTTFYDAANASGDWTGLDLGSPKKIGRIRYAPRSTWPERMTDGQFQASNSPDFSSGVVTLHTVSGIPAVGVLASVAVNDAGSYRYVRYLSPTDGYCNIAEVEFYEDGGPDAPTGLSANSASGQVDLDWVDNDDADLASYNVYRGTSSGNYDLTPIATGLTQSQYSDSDITNNTTYFYVVSAVDSDGLEGANSNEATVEYVVNDVAPVVDAGTDQTVTMTGEAAWTPAQLTTAAWYDASDAGTITAGGGAVSQWADKGVTGLHLSQDESARQPLTGTATINGLNAIKFDGHRLATASNPFGETVDDAFVMVVHRVDSTATSQTLFSLTGSEANSSRWQAHAPWGSTIYFDAGNTGSGHRVSTAYGSGVGSVVLLGLYCSVSDSVQQIFKDGTLLAADTSGHSVNTVGNVFVGSGGGNQYQNTSIGEMIIINGTVNATERQELEGYLAHKWGLVANLPVDHLYVAAPPGGAGASAELDATVSDADGNPLTTIWSQVSGAGSVSFANASQVDTTASFSEAGVYVLRLTADDGVFQTSDEVTITVSAESASDTDGDGMDDAWEIAYFGDLSQGPTDDFDNDRDDNLTEFTNQTDPTVDDVAPAAPTGLTATVGDGQITLNWNDSDETDLNSYRVYRSTTNGAGFTLLQAALGVSALVDESAVNETTYYYYVTAVDNAANESADSIGVSATPVGGLLVSVGPDGRLVYETYANEGQTNEVNTVPDYSRAGYGGGGVEIPFVPAAVTLSDDGAADDTTRIQNAIDTVSALPLVDNFRGAVLLEAGNYTVSSTLNLNASGVVIRGQGQQASGGTTITYTSTTQSDLFHVHGSSNPSYVGSSARPITDAYVPVGSMTLNVTDATPFAPGDLVRIRNTMNQQWIDDIGMTEAGGLLGAPDDPAWDPSAFQLSHYRYVTEVNGNELTLDAPIVQVIETQYGGGEVLKYTYTGAIENVGIENLRMESTYTAEDDEAHGWEAIEMRRVKNGWVRQITARYFGMGLVLVDDFSQFITVEDCAMLDPKSITTGGRKYSFNVDDSSYNLVQRTLTRGGRHDYASGSITPGPNVFVDGHATQANSDIGPHFRYATGELYDNIKTDGEINVQNRLNAGTSHGWSGAQIMFWNVNADSIISDAPTGAMNWSIGAVGNKSESPSFMSPWEPFGIWQSHNQHVTPRSLYYAQLQDRLGLDAVRGVTLPAQAAGTVWTALQSWDGEGRFLDAIVIWYDDSAALEVDNAINVSARIRDLNILESLSSTTWSQVSGPGNVSFGDPALLETTMSFDQQGTYVLQLTADDGSSQVSGTLELFVADPNFAAPPLAPTALEATAGNGSISLDWADNTEANVTYTLKRSTTSGSGYLVIQSGLTASAYLDESVTNGTTYFYIVTASVPGSAESVASAPQSALPNAAPVFEDNSIIEAGATEGSAYSSSLVDNANDADLDELTFTRVTGPDWLTVATDGALTGTPDADDLGLNEWTVRVSDGNGGQDESLLRITVANAVPTAPLGLSATPGNNSVSLNWADSPEADWASYRVLRSETEGSGYVEIANSLGVSAYVDDTVVNGTTYHYVVRAVDGGGLVSPDSLAASATPVAPSEVAVLATDNAYIRASEVDTVHDVSEIFYAHRAQFVFGAREGYIRFPVSGDDELGGVDVDSITSISLDLYATTGSAHTIYLYALLDGVQFDGTTLSESTWTGGSGGTGGNLTPNLRPLGLSAGLPVPGQTTILLGSASMPASAGVLPIVITELEAFKQLIRDDTNGEITLLLNSNGNDNANVFASVYNDSDNPIPTLTATVAASDTTPPAAPASLMATPGYNSITLNWADNDETDFASYAVFRRETGGSYGAALETGLTVSEFVDATALNGTEYVYIVRAVDDAGNVSTDSNEASATPSNDLDGDGIDDLWETENLGNTDSDGSGDLDGDGVADFFEYLYGSDPDDSASRGFQLKAGTAGATVLFDWDVDAAFVLGTHYQIEVSTDLSDPAGWSVLPSDHYDLNQIPNAGKMELELNIKQAHQATYGDHVFIRLVSP